MKSAKNLIPSPHNIGPNGTILRPYLKLHLYPFKSARKKTQPVEAGNDLSPVFNSSFIFKVLIYQTIRNHLWFYEFFRIWILKSYVIVRWKFQSGTMSEIRAVTFSVEYGWTLVAVFTKENHVTGWLRVEKVAKGKKFLVVNYELIMN